MNTVENEFVLLSLDKENGSLLEIRDKISEWNIIRQPRLAGLVRLLVPVGEFRNNRIVCDRQQPGFRGWS